ncbi:MBL fold metallo-hydrolase [Rhizobium sp. SGZ-381]|uniref:MBL fold metallo-hydrolase n=1 Tax=Rhizobium sp. SGZ-381 TaxID=3342800 RepID=UPI003670905E
MFAFGPARIRTLADLDPFALPIDLLFPGRDVEMLRPLQTVLAPHHVDFDTGSILLGVHSHLLQTAGLNILIDTCIGEHKPRPRRADWHQRAASGYLERLASAGLRAEDIDIVLCTHLHADHVGWNTKLVDGRWVPTFPRARYLIGRAEFDLWREQEESAPGTHNHGSFIDSVQPVVDAGQAEFVDDGFAVAGGLDLVALPGHTRGQLGLCLCHQDRRAIFCADAIHTPVQVFHPDWASRFCSDPQAAIATRHTLLDQAASRDDLLVPAHLRHYSGMRIRGDASGSYRPEFVA